MHKYRIGDRLGEGSFAVVYRASTSDGTTVAIKKIKEPQPSRDACLSLRELRSLKSVGRHPNIVLLRDTVYEKRELSFVFEFLPCNLHQLCRSAPPFSEAKVARMSADLLRGLGYMHQKGFFHRDIKPENILCDASGETLKLGDLGLAREIRSRPPYTDCTSSECSNPHPPGGASP
jgi:serine/threonine protein kinase